MSGREDEEYRALRATIRQRGTARVCIFVAGIAVWAGLALGTAAVSAAPVATLLPLLMLAAAFEAVFSLHIGIERIGRYLQVFHETGGEQGWEHAAMTFGRPVGAAASDPLFIVPFLIATIFNAAPVAVLHPAPVEIVFVGGAHALVLLRIAVGRATAARQRAVDLARFQQIKAAQI